MSIQVHLMSEASTEGVGALTLLLGHQEEHLACKKTE